MALKFTVHQRHIFAMAFATYGDIEKAALKIGVKPECALEDGWSLFHEPAVKEEIRVCCKELQEFSAYRIQTELITIACDPTNSDSVRMKALEHLIRLRKDKTRNDTDKFRRSDCRSPKL